MNGQTRSFNEKMATANKFIQQVKPYEKKEGLNFDLRGYSQYLKENNIPGNNVPPSVLKMFSR